MDMAQHVINQLRLVRNHRERILVRHSRRHRHGKPAALAIPHPLAAQRKARSTALGDCG